MTDEPDIAVYHRMYGRPYAGCSDAELRRRFRDAVRAEADDPTDTATVNMVTDTYAEAIARNVSLDKATVEAAETLDDDDIRRIEDAAKQRNQEMIDRATGLLIIAERNGNQEVATELREVIRSCREPGTT